MFEAFRKKTRQISVLNSTIGMNRSFLYAVSSVSFSAFSFHDYDLYNCMITDPIGSAELGRIAIESLAHAISFDSEADYDDHIQRNIPDDQAETWLDRQAARLDSVSAQALLKPKFLVHLVQKNDVLSVRGSEQIGLDRYRGSPGFDGLELPASSTPEQVGRAVREAFSRSTSKYGDVSPIMDRLLINES